MHLPKAGPRYRASCSLCSAKPHARLLARSLVRSFVRSVLNRWKRQPNVLRGSVASSDPCSTAHLSRSLLLLSLPTSIHISVHPSIHPSLHPSIHPSIHPSTYPTIHPFVHPSCWKPAHRPQTIPLVSLLRLIRANLRRQVDRSSTRAKSHRVHALFVPTYFFPPRPPSIE